MRARSAVKLWNRFWFEPGSPTPVALFRIALGMLLLQDILTMRLPDWRIFYSLHPLIPVNTFMQLWWGREPRFDLFQFLPTDELRLGLLCLYALFCLGMVLGLFTRVSCLGALLINESMFNHFTLAVSGADVFLKIGLLITTFSNAGDAFSLDNLRRAFRSDWRKDGFRPPAKPQWALRMLQLEVCVVYLITVLYKLSGEQWIDGTAVYYVSRSEDLRRFYLPFFFDHYWMMKILTWATLAFEGAFVFLVWIKEFRYQILWIGVLFHLGIEWACNIPLFEMAMISSFLLFIYPEDITKCTQFLKENLAEKFGPARVILFDDARIRQVYLTGFIHRLDIFGRLQILSIAESDKPLAQASDSLILVDGDKSHTGFEAMRGIAKSVPWGWLVLPVLYLPLLSSFSRRLFTLAALSQLKRKEPLPANLALDDRKRFSLLYVQLMFLILMVGLVGLANVPMQIIEAQKIVRRSETLDIVKVRALKQLSLEKDETAPASLQSLSALGWVYLQEKDKADAEKTFQKALAASRRRKGDVYDPAFASALSDMAVYYRDTNDFGRAQDLFLELQEYDLKYKPQDHLVNARDLGNLALVAYLDSESIAKKEVRQQILEKALSLCGEAERQLQEVPEAHRPLGNLLSTKYFILRNLGDRKNAQIARRESQRILAVAHNQTIEP